MKKTKKSFFPLDRGGNIPKLSKFLLQNTFLKFHY